ncbi:MAG: hypothetical protein IJJ79_05020 [Lachnospiraceae bacterium]|nr:hypothetical protein [Lachnospiraceae bacterium]
MPDVSNREALEDAKRELAEIDARIKEHEHEIARLNAEKAKIMKTMSLLMDSSTEERLLAEVYEQRKKMRS